MGLVRRWREWRARRRRFAEEWAFHRERAISEFESLGMSSAEARKLARQRMGRYGKYRRAAVGIEWGAALNGALRHRFRRSPWLAPAMLAAIGSLLLACNPQRRQAVESLRGVLPWVRTAPVGRFVPLTPPGLVPMDLAALTLWSFALLGLARLAGSTRRAPWRVWGFGAAGLAAWMAFGAVCWTTVLQLLTRSRWGHDGLQGAALLLFFFGYVGGAFLAVRFWYRDLESRCPVCLRRCGLADTRGHAYDVLVEPMATETVCLEGHGLNVNSRWGRVFGPGDAPSPLA